MLNTVAAAFSASLPDRDDLLKRGVKSGANMKQNPNSLIDRFKSSLSAVISIPIASSKLELPQRDVIDRLPCFKTGIPAAAKTNVTVVLILNVCCLSPPVPHIDRPLAPFP